MAVPTKGRASRKAGFCEFHSRFRRRKKLPVMIKVLRAAAFFE
jgi:hypothetical protein